jgi:AI-2 transport protein TqsA
MMTVQRELRIQTVCLLVLAILAATAAAYWLKPVLIPFILAIFFTYSLLPLADLLRRYVKLPRWLALVVTLLVGVGALTAVALITTASLRRFAQNSHLYVEQLQLLRESAVEALPLTRMGLDPEDLEASLLQGSEQYVGRLLRSSLDGVLNFLSNSVMVLIFMLFLLLGKLTGPTAHHGRSTGLLGEIERNIENYILAKVVISIATGALHGLILLVLGVPFAVVFGVLAFLLNFIPNLGPVIATLVPLPVVLLNPELSPAVKVLAIALPGVLQTVSGNVVEPKWMGDSLDLHPITVLITLIFFGMLWGLAGMFLATPITAIVKILFEKMEVTRPLSRVMAGRLDDLTDSRASSVDLGTQQAAVTLPPNLKKVPRPSPDAPPD